ncbi:hypothetical protein [Halopolyspora algeriensis]|uniref:hypothetical protein n=1 Tax=Halopolyspora algeriensis TaxID=1500506 RepID=UPI0014772BE2|nr:hypothetical protein [Halopolyspora algeriensis]
MRDPRAAELVPAAQSPDPVRRVIASLDPDLAEDRDLLAAVENCAHYLQADT